MKVNLISDYRFYAAIFIIHNLTNNLVPLPILLGLNITLVTFLILRRSIGLILLFYFSVIYALKTLYLEIGLNDLGYTINFLLFLLITSEKFNHPKKAKLPNWLIVIPLIMLASSFIGYNNYQNIELSAKGANPEYYRSYNTGLFVSPHIAAYFLFFIGHTLIYQEKRNLIGLSYFLGSLLTGTRSSLIAIIVSGLYHHISIKKLKQTLVYLAGLIGLTLYLYLNISLFQGTFIYQFISIIETVFNNLHRLSRVQLILIFWENILEFNWLEILFGRSFEEQMNGIQKAIGTKIWFHNDILAIFYTYGLIGLTALILGFLRIWRNSKTKFQRSALLSILVLSISNGILFHPFLIYIILSKNHYEDSYYLNSNG